MNYFTNASIGDEVFGLIFGPGKIIAIIDGFYSIEVEFKNGYSVHYTPEGVPNWGNFDSQTLYYKKDIDVFSLRTCPIDRVLDPKEIITLRESGELEIRCPSGNWINVTKCDQSYVEKTLESEKFHLFKKKDESC